MINQERLKDVLIEYKQAYVTRQWKDEKYKWEAVKWFQDHWDVNASEFADMLDLSLDKTYNLLASRNSFPRIMIVEFARVAPEQIPISQCRHYAVRIRFLFVICRHRAGNQIFSDHPKCPVQLLVVVLRTAPVWASRDLSDNSPPQSTRAFPPA